MKKITDEQIQAMLETELKRPANALSAQEDEQVQRYQSLFQKLNKEPVEGLPFNFASKVTDRLKTKLKKRSDIKFNLLAAVGIVIGLAAMYGLLTIIDFNAANNFLLTIIKFKWLFVICSFVLLGSLIFDQRVAENN